jgi:hypothetical protein
MANSPGRKRGLEGMALIAGGASIQANQKDLMARDGGHSAVFLDDCP